MATTTVQLAPLFQLEGASNFRSLEGVPTLDGRHIRANVLFRSDELSRLTDADWAKLRDMRLIATCDLRRRDEREAYVAKVPADMTVHEYWWPYDDEMLAIMADMTAQIRAALEPLASMDDATLDAWVESRYAAYGSGFAKIAPHIRSVFEVVLKHGRDGAVLVHCAAGKDRTGFAIAALLAAVGVSREAILDDYVRTSEAYIHNPPPREHLQTLLRRNGLDTLPQRVIDKLCLAPRGAMNAAFDYLEATFGSVDGFLTQAVGVTLEEREALRQILVAPEQHQQ